jgi:hypothetical protein
MSELITFLVALPLLHEVGLFYWRLGAWLRRALCLGGQAILASDRADQP